MKKISIIGFLSLFLLIIACNKNNYKEMIVTKSKEIDLYPTNSDNTNNYYGTYQGKVPCPDCGFETSILLTINQDDTYKLKSFKRNECVIIRGDYSVEGNTILLSNGDEFKLESNRKLLKINLPFKGNNKIYVLNRID